MTSSKKVARRKKEPIENEEFFESYKKNFDCSSIKMKKQLPLTDNQTAFYHLSQNDRTNIMFLDGPAGSAKSYIAVYSALELLKNREVDKIIYIRTVVESSARSLGYLKGDENEKFSPFTMVLNEKCLEIIEQATLFSMMENGYIKAIPVNFVRGLTFNNAAVIIDEAQNATRSELVTILTRFGRNSKYFICGDMNQSDIKDSGFGTVFNAFDTEHSRKNHIHCVKFDNSDIVRSGILKHITQVLKV